MANSLELRSPLLDVNVVEWGTPADFFNNPQTTAAKQFLKFSAGLLV
jgi:ABC-type histidine transport system ATPase subunit